LHRRHRLRRAGVQQPPKPQQHPPRNPNLLNNINQLQKYADHQQQEGRSPETLETITKRLSRLAKYADLESPEQVKDYIAKAQWHQNTKRNVAQLYNGYAKYCNIRFDLPHYTREDRIPFIPTEQEADTLIAASRPPLNALLQILKETGARLGEATKLTWNDIDTERKTLNITPEKGSKPRTQPISNKLIGMLNQIPHINNKIFKSNKKTLETTFRAIRKRTAQRLGNQRLTKITFHTYRHYYATMWYHDKPDVCKLQQRLGHRDVKSTMIYISLEESLFLNTNDQFIIKVANNTAEATKLLEIGFEYVQTTPNGDMIYRKRK
jgi:integrase